MSEENNNGSDVNHQTQSHKGKTRIWRTQGSPLGSGVSEGDRRFIHRALVFSGVALVFLAVLGFLAFRNLDTAKQAYASLLISQSNFSQAERVIRSVEDEDVKEKLQQRYYYFAANYYVKKRKN